MTWIRLDDQLPEDPKFIEVGHRGIALYVAGLCYCSRNLTDGVIPKGAVPRLTDVARPKQVAQSLVDAELWLDAGHSYEVHKYLQYQQSRSTIEANREAKRQAGRAGGLARSLRRATPSGSNPPNLHTDIDTHTDTHPNNSSSSSSKTHIAARGRKE